jgi:hypothetical protein
MLPGEAIRGTKEDDRAPVEGLHLADLAPAGSDWLIACRMDVYEDDLRLGARRSRLSPNSPTLIVSRVRLVGSVIEYFLVTPP